MWVREHHELHRLTRSAKSMRLKSLTHRYNFQNEARWSSQSRDLMVCSLALDPRFKHFAVQLCGLPRGENYVWGVVKDAALRHRKFEKRSDEVPPPAPKRPLGSRVEAALMTNFNSQLADAARASGVSL